MSTCVFCLFCCWNLACSSVRCLRARRRPRECVLSVLSCAGMSAGCHGVCVCLCVSAPSPPSPAQRLAIPPPSRVVGQPQPQPTQRPHTASTIHRAHPPPPRHHTAITILPLLIRFPPSRHTHVFRRVPFLSPTTLLHPTADPTTRLPSLPPDADADADYNTCVEDGRMPERALALAEPQPAGLNRTDTETDTDTDTDSLENRDRASAHFRVSLLISTIL